MSTPRTLLVRCGTVYLSPLRLGRYDNAITQSCPRGAIQHNPLQVKKLDNITEIDAERDLLYVQPTNPDLRETTWMNTTFRGLGCV